MGGGEGAAEPEEVTRYIYIYMYIYIYIYIYGCVYIDRWIDNKHVNAGSVGAAPDS